MSDGRTYLGSGFAAAFLADADIAAGLQAQSVANGIINRTSMYFGPQAATVSTATPGLGYCYLVPVTVEEALTFDRICIEITTAIALAAPRLGIFTRVAAEMTLLLDAGTVDGTTTGFKEIVISQPVTAGEYWLGFVNQGAAAGVRTQTGSRMPVGALVGLNASVNAYGAGVATQTFAGALTNCNLNTGNNVAPRVIVRVA